MTSINIVCIKIMDRSAEGPLKSEDLVEVAWDTGTKFEDIGSRMVHQMRGRSIHFTV